MSNEQQTIEAYLDAKTLTGFQQTENGIYYRIDEQGSGDAHPVLTDVLEVHYEGSLLNDTIFDSSIRRGEPAQFQLSRVIPGWQQAIPLLKKGGKGTFIIPSGLAYGSRGAGASIPPNSVLRFDVSLLDFYSEEEAIERQQEREIELIRSQVLHIQQYIQDKGWLGFQMSPEGIFYQIAQPGGAAKPHEESIVKTHYKGTLLNGTVFDSSYDRGQPLEFGLNQVIQGWQIAIPMLGKGGKGTFIIPSSYAYGKRGAGRDIPADAILIFEVELLDFFEA